MNTAETLNDTKEASIWAQLSSLPREVWIIFLGSFINRLGTFVIPFLMLHLTRLGFTAGQISFAMAAYGLGHIFATLVGGYLADTLGKKQTIVISMVSGAVLMFALSHCREPWSLSLFLALLGLSAEAYRPASSAMITDLVPIESRTMAYAAYRFAINAGWAIGPALGGFLATKSYLWLFWGDAASCLVFARIAALALENRPPEATGTEKERSLLPAGYRACLRHKRFLMLTLSTLLVAFVFMQMHSTLSLQMRHAGYSEVTYGALLALNGVLIIIFEIPLVPITTRFHPNHVIAFGYTLIALGVACFALFDHLAIYILGMTSFTFGELISMPIVMTLVSRIAPAHQRGQFMGFHGMAWGMAIAIGPSTGVLLFNWSPDSLWYLATGCGLLATLLILKLKE